MWICTAFWACEMGHAEYWVLDPEAAMAWHVGYCVLEIG